jgi:DEAD/DEAH box helicase domain-containing protein
VLETEALASLPSPTAPLEAALDEVQRRARGWHGGITAIRRLPAREPRYADLPPDLPPSIVRTLKARGIERLYLHQAETYRLACEGRNVVVVTPTASGKTLCYNLPILSALANDADARALYLFPTKALAQDQLTELNRWGEQLDGTLRTFTYDGDTPQDARQAIRARANLVISNPDMLHTGILPHHTKWERLFENLRYVVLDELHVYRGVFGSHVANVLRRLKRIARFYGSHPQFLLTSATIANPAVLARRLLEENVALVDQNGAPAAEKHFVLYNPPVVNAELGIRRSYLEESRRVARAFLERGLQTIVFANSRLATEILVTYLKQDFSRGPAAPEAVRGYRGGYLPRERREIESGLREGRLLGVVSTNALELGIDVGSLDAAILAGYPGTIASTWQRAGRAGRRQGASAAVLVASSAPLDQFIVQNPEYFFGRSPEHAYVNPDNLQILLSHLKCAAFELPLRDDERFGNLDLKTLCRFLEETGFLHHTPEGWHWISDSYPADAVSLRSVSSDNFVIVDTTHEPRVIGEVDFASALTTVHEKAIYLQDGQQYHVERLDYDDRKAYVHEVQSEYFTDAISYTKIKILETFESAPLREDSGARSQEGKIFRTPRKSHGEVRVNTQVVGFKKIKFHTHENVGSGQLMLPEQEMHTTAYWLTLPGNLLAALPYSNTERLDGVNGLAHAMRAMATLLVMCDARDLGVTVGESARLGGETAQSRSPVPGPPAFELNIYLYDRYPGGVGLSEPLFRLSEELLENTRKLIAGCPCPQGCPSCVGPTGEVGPKGKEAALAILRLL